MTRADQKQKSLEKILEVASTKLREDGIDGASISKVMADAGLTHGAFYAHFANKEELASRALRHAIDTSQPGWFDDAGNTEESFGDRLSRLARSYLSRTHRDDVGHGCAISALVSDNLRSMPSFRKAYGEVVAGTLEKIAAGDKNHRDDAILFLVLCVGGLTLARSVDSNDLSDRILSVARHHIDTMTD